MPDAGCGFLTVYCLGPVCGGAVAAVLFTRVFEPMMNRRQGTRDCQ